MKFLKGKLHRPLQFAAIILASFLILSLGCGKKDQGVIKIGAILPLTGNVSIFGEWIKQGIEIGIEDSKRENPQLSNRIEILYEDSRNEPSAGISALNKLITAHGVDVIISAMSRVSIPLIPITEKKQIPLLLQDVTYPNITKQGKMIFRHFIQSDREAKILAEFGAEVLQLSKIAILHVNDEAGVGAKESFKASFEKFGQVIIEESYESREPDFRTPIAKILSSRVEAVFLFGNGPSWANALRTLKEMGFEGTVLTNTAMYIPIFRNIAGIESIEGVYFTYPYIDTTTLSAKHFIYLYKTKHEAFPPIEAAYGYDLIRFIVLSLEVKTGSTLFDKLSSIKELEGAFGKLHIDENREMLTNIAVAKIESGEITNLSIKF